MGLLVLAVVGIASRADAGIITVPPGLAPGSQYRLVFVTAVPSPAVFPYIGFYNTAVNAAADAVAALAALGTTWLDIGSTAAVSAIDNIGMDAGVPIYDLGGNLIATDAGTGAGGMFSGTILNVLDITEGGVALGAVGVWTGSWANGATVSYAPLGGGSDLMTEYGWVGFTDQRWLQYLLGDPYDTAYHLYGISEALTSPGSTTPEPATTGMVIAGGALMFFAGRRSRRPL